jgi:hypothetical protein
MGWLEAIPIIGDLFKGTTDIIKEAVTDKDKQNEIIGNLEELKRQFEQALYLKELDTKTVPWVDALHKMGRQCENCKEECEVRIERKQKCFPSHDSDKRGYTEHRAE